MIRVACYVFRRARNTQQHAGMVKNCEVPRKGLYHMELGGLHHVTAVTGDAPENVASTPTCSVCGWSRRPSTRTTSRPITSSMATRPAAPGTEVTFFDWAGMATERPRQRQHRRDRRCACRTAPRSIGGPSASTSCGLAHGGVAEIAAARATLALRPTRRGSGCAGRDGGNAVAVHALADSPVPVEHRCAASTTSPWPSTASRRPRGC